MRILQAVEIPFGAILVGLAEQAAQFEFTASMILGAVLIVTYDVLVTVLFFIRAHSHQGWDIIKVGG